MGVRGHRLQLVACATAAAVALCAPVVAQAAPPTRVPGVLVVGLHPSTPRFETGRVSGSQVVEPRGLEADLARAIGGELGLKVEFRYVAHTAAFLSPGAKPWDIGLDRITAADPAAEVPYLQVREAVLLRRGLVQQVTSVSDLRWLKLCARRGSPGAALIGTLVRPTIAPAFARSGTGLLAALAAGRCDAVIDDAPALAAARAVAPGRYGPFAGSLPAPAAEYAIALPESSPLTPSVARAVRRIGNDHELRSLSVKWLGEDLQTIPALPAGPHTTTVTLIGDSVSATFAFVPAARDVLAQGLDFHFDGQTCRRLIEPSCGIPQPPTAVQTIVALGHGLGQVVVMDVGYNDSPSTYGSGIDAAMRDMLAEGVRRVIWVTLRETRSYFATTNEVIRAARNRWPELIVADWNSYSAGKPWFAADGIHLNPSGAVGLARFLRPYVSPG